MGSHDVTIKKDITRTLAGVGLSCDPDKHDSGDFAKWEVTSDNTIQDSFNSDVVFSRGRFLLFGVEVKSSAYSFNAEALKKVEFAAGVLTSKYCLQCNHPSMGLHCRVGNAHDGFPYYIIQRLLGLGAYKFGNVFEHAFDKDNNNPTRIRTTEFRQHRRSLDGQEIKELSTRLPENCGIREGA